MSRETVFSNREPHYSKMREAKNGRQRDFCVTRDWYLLAAGIRGRVACCFWIIAGVGGCVILSAAKSVCPPHLRRPPSFVVSAGPSPVGVGVLRFSLSVSVPCLHSVKTLALRKLFF